jgi:quercetin dioxygenase-like cupin family protein
MSLPSTPLHPTIRQAGEHQRLAYTGGHELTVILDAAITGGQLTVIETHARSGDASPVHVHSRDDEAFLLLDGAMTVWAGDQRHQLQPGGIAFLPRRLPHAVRYDTASRALILSTPGRVPGARVPGGRLGPEPAPARRLAAHPGRAPPGRRAGRGHAARAAPRPGD